MHKSKYASIVWETVDRKVDLKQLILFESENID